MEDETTAEGVNTEDDNTAENNDSAQSPDALTTLLERTEALLARADELAEKLDGIRESMSAFVDNGAVVSEEDSEDDNTPEDDIDFDTAIEDMDFSLDED